MEFVEAARQSLARMSQRPRKVIDMEAYHNQTVKDVNSVSFMVYPDNYPDTGINFE